jgi:NAD+ diphosphatase
MIGCSAQASDTDIVVDTAELEDTRWFSRPEAAARERMRARCRPKLFAIAHHLLHAYVAKGASEFRSRRQRQCRFASAALI